HYWHVRAKDAAGNYSDWSTIFSFTVDTSLPEVPTLTSPANGATLDDSTPTFNWSEVTGATTYYLKISTTQTFSSITFEETISSGTSYTLSSSDALANGTYYWKVSSNLDDDSYSDVRSFTVDVDEDEQPVNFQVIVRSGATGAVLENATVKLTSGTSTIDTAQTNASGIAYVSAPPGTYTMSVTKNSWDSGSGEAYSKQITVSSSANVFYDNLYQSGFDLLVASITYNDKNSTEPSSIVIYKDGVVYLTLALDHLPPSSMMTTNLTLANTNLIVEVPSGSTYQIADPSYTDGKVSITNLSTTLSSAYVNSVTLQVTASVTGMVVDGSGNTITGASVMLLRQSDSAIIGAAESSSFGFVFSLVLPETYYLRIQKTGYDTVVSSSFTVSPNVAHNAGMITMTQLKGMLNVTVQSDTGSVLDNVTIEISDTDGTLVFSEIAAQGIIIGIELPGGTYTISATKSGYELSDTVTAVVTAEETTSKTVIMTEETEPEPETGSIQISVTDSDENPLQLVNVYLGNEKVGVTNQDGVLLIEDLTPQTYQVTLKKDGYDDISFSLVVTAGETSTNTKSMSVAEEVEGSSRMKWILIAAAVVIVFAIVLVALTKRKPGEEGPEEKPATARPSPERKAMAAPPDRRGREQPPTGRPIVSGGGIPSSSKRDTGSGKDDERKGGGIPTHSMK
ncbi:MAG TPA: carboxypeptidase regulatory-like domain-containing protein, partial [Candidatus Methanofastidiosa archaeon]|nr:carboxypeptidase regulatory-like domain-containing protein [Candidatus Methanofastidiosa archaeon]